MKHFLSCLLVVVAACAASETGDNHPEADASADDVGASDTLDITVTDEGSPPASDTKDGGPGLEDVGETKTADPETDDTTVDVKRPVPVCSEASPVTTAKEVGKVSAPGEPGRSHAQGCGRVVWAGKDGGLNALDLETGTSQVLVGPEQQVQWPDIHENSLVYVAGSPTRVHLLNLATNKSSVVEETTSPQLRPRISAKVIAWEVQQGNFASVRILDRQTGKLSWADLGMGNLAFDQRFVAVSGDTVVWTDFRSDAKNYVWDGDGSDLTDIWWRQGDAAPEPLVEAKYKQSFAEIDGDRIIWLDWRNVAHKLDSNGHPRPEPKLEHFEVWTSLAGDSGHMIASVSYGSYEGLPTIIGGKVAWAGGGSKIFGLDLLQENAEVVVLSKPRDKALAPLLGASALQYVSSNGLHVVPAEF